MRYLAIDFGKQRTGLALCDADETLASPLTVLAGPDNTPAAIVAVIAAYEVEALVVGLPLNMDGSEGGQARTVRGWTQALRRLTALPIHFQDERLSSFAAREKRPDLRGGRRRRGRPIDALAAAEILAAFLDTQRNVAPTPSSPPDAGDVA